MSNTNENKKIGKLRKTIRNLYPTYIYEKVEDIPYDLIQELNIRLVMLDMDNTLIDNIHSYSKELKKWADQFKNKGVRLYILSNSPFGNVVEKIAGELGMEYHYNASKPFLKGFKKVIEKTNIPKENIMMVGDQLFTDVFGGNRFGIKTVLVRPINKKEAFVTKIKRPFEKIILKHYMRKKGDL